MGERLASILLQCISLLVPEKVRHNLSMSQCKVSVQWFASDDSRLLMPGLSTEMLRKKHEQLIKNYGPVRH